MSKKTNRRQRPQSQQSAAPKAVPEIKKDITVEEVKASTSEPEFEAKRKQLIEKLVEEAGFYETERKTAEDALETANKTLETIRVELKKLEDEKKALRKEYDGIQKDYTAAVTLIENADSNAEKKRSAAEKETSEMKESAEKEADGIRSSAESDAQAIRENAEKDRLATLTRAEEEAKEAWKSQADGLQKQLDDIAAREQALQAAQLKLESHRRDLDYQKEELRDLEEYVKRMKEKYSAASPIRVTELETECREANERYMMLLEKYNRCAERLEEAQVLLDTIKTGIEDPEKGIRPASVREIVTLMQEYKERLRQLEYISQKFPDIDSFEKLEDRAAHADALEIEKNALVLERNRYREEVVAANNAKKELGVVKQEVEATKALNEHLLHELERHKTALESRTGDTCPSLTKVDIETEERTFIEDIVARMRKPSVDSLKKVVSHVKNYAGSRSREKQLYYTDNDIRAFLAGMAVSRLIILQGMSGTGKSSLPRIFSEAISGFNRLIPVESSWRDRNELLGYYNDFNKKFNAKSFTIELYRSGKERCREIPTFIVLDEMNLARIEYYFSDFLAILQEPDHGKWLIELVPSDMRTLPMELPDDLKKKMKQDQPAVYKIWENIEKSRQGDLRSETSDDEKETLTRYLDILGCLTGAKDLIDGRKIRVTDNIWFIGTANRDESTFEISDKVYDRAQIITLNSKGVPEDKYESVSAGFISVTDLQQLFEKAVAGNEYRKEVEERLRSIDSTLINEFDTSFGNRIVTQTLDFVGVFTAAGGTIIDALDYQISTKILRKVLTSDDSAALEILRQKMAEYPKSSKLIKKRLKELR